MPRHSVNRDRLERVAEGLLDLRAASEQEPFWRWITETPLTKRNANKFMMGAIVDYHQPAERSWNSVQRVAEELLGDPESLWQVVSGFDEAGWMSRKREFRLHINASGHMRVWKIGRRIENEYGGDAREIWKDCDVPAAVCRLEELGVGPELSRMVGGALHDAGILEGAADVKADVHVSRVLGRLLFGESLRPAEATSWARRVWPRNPWLLDRPLYQLGKSVCSARSPNCTICAMRKACRFADNRRQ